MSAVERDFEDALRALVAARTPESGAAERAWVIMQRRIVDGRPPLDIDAPSEPKGGAVRWIAIGTSIAAVLVAAVGLGRWSAGWLALGEQSTAVELPYSTSRVETIPHEAVIVEAIIGREPDRSSHGADVPPIAPMIDEVGALPPTPQPIAVVKRERRSRSAAASRPSAPTLPSAVPAVTTTTLAAELRLLARAQAAMRAGDPAGSLVALDEHAREFEDGQLAPERDYKRALAQCGLGRSDEARAIAEAFVRRYPRSPLRHKAATVCRQG